MEEMPVGFILILLGILLGTIFVTVAAFLVKEHRVKRLKNPHRDYLNGRG